MQNLSTAQELIQDVYRPARMGTESVVSSEVATITPAPLDWSSFTFEAMFRELLRDA